jgi:hypothetical protein
MLRQHLHRIDLAAAPHIDEWEMYWRRLQLPMLKLNFSQRLATIHPNMQG